jgi:secreted trypsin-like serine protease
MRAGVRLRLAARAAAATLLLVLLILLDASSGASAATARPRIVAGSATPITQAPFQVALYDPEDLVPGQGVFGAQFCGGVIRDATHIVTAAHCVTFGGFEAAAPDEIEVLAGASDLEHPELGVEDPVVTTSFDPEWSPFSHAHDVGVLTLQTPLWTGATPTIDGVNKIAPIEFASGPVLAGDEATISGWGYTQHLTPQQAEEAEELTGSATLQSAKVSIVGLSECSADYKAEGPGQFTDEFICAIGGELPTTDSCFGDSGGPLFSTGLEPSDDRLLGLVDFGTGCAEPTFPGVYQSVIEASNRAFATSDPPQAPLRQSDPSITGTPQSGETVTCDPGAWLGSPELFYRYYRDESSDLHPFLVKPLTAGFFADATYVIQPSDAGTSLFCVVLARNGGGFGDALSRDVEVAALPQAAPVAAAAPAPPVASPAPHVAPVAPAQSPPTLRVVSASCRRSTCSVDVRVSSGTGAARVTSVDAKLAFTRKLACRRDGRRAICTRTITRKLAAKQISGAHFAIVATRLQPGRYTLALRAVDSAGLRQTHATTVALLVKHVRASRR